MIEDYWDDKRTNKSISVGYNGGFRNVNYYLGYSYNRYTWSGNNSGKDAQDDQRITLTVTLPLSNWLPGTYTSYQLTNSNPGSTDQSVSIGGVGLDNDSLEWSLQQGYSNREYYSGDMRGTYNGARGSLNAGYSYDNNSQRIDYGANGSIVAHADGITLGQDITDAAVLVKAPGLDNVKLTNDNTISTDYRGYAIVPYVTPYRRTDITLDSTSLGEDMELPETTQSVVPTRGAIVRANYDGNIGQRAFVHLKTASGQDVPYGAMVLLAGDSKSQPSIVSDAGMVYMSGLQETGILNVQWGKSAAQQCNASFTLPARKAKRLASVKSKRFVANIDQGTIKNEKNTSFLSLLCCCSEVIAKCDYSGSAGQAMFNISPKIATDPTIPVGTVLYTKKSVPDIIKHLSAAK